MNISEISELALLEDLSRIERRYVAEFGADPVNLSHWDVAPSTKRKLQFDLPQSDDLSAVDYAFSYTTKELPTVLEGLGFTEGEFGCLLTHSGSASIVAVANWLRVHGKKRVLIAGPRYFTVPHAFDAMGITHEVIYCRRTEGIYHLPDALEHEISNYDALWITNPVYCTSIYYSVEDHNRLGRLADSGSIIIIDECLSEPGRRIAPRLRCRPGIISIHAPHKMICVNGVKFSTIVFPKTQQTSFDTWTDVWSGCLPLSSVLGIRHFSSDLFEQYYLSFKIECARLHNVVKSIVGRFRHLEVDMDADGYLISIYVPALPAALGLDLNFLERAAWESGAIFISGARNEIDPCVGLSFRVNLAAFDVTAQGALQRLCYFLEGEADAASSK